MPGILLITSGKKALRDRSGNTLLLRRKTIFRCSAIILCIDRTYSAKTDHRPAFQEMIKDSTNNIVFNQRAGRIVAGGSPDARKEYPAD